MRQVVPPSVLTQKILGTQKINSGTPRRLSVLCLRIEQPEGVLLYHTLTGELLLLSYEEAAEIEELRCTVSPVIEKLAARWFLRPVAADDMALTEQVREIAQHIRKGDGALTDYLIFTTTACNARCFYCFESGMQRKSMSEETAKAAGAYIANHCGGKPVRVVWFGGEPLLNIRAIDAIAGELRRRGVEFSSRMDSNGYLFDEALVARAKEDWELRQVQITVDGTEEVYNRRKAYVHPEGSPYRRVLRNIGLLLDAGIQVTVRLNMDEENERDLYALVDDLAECFAGKSGFQIYCRVLIENKGVEPVDYTEEERRSLAEKARAMWAYLDRKGVAFRRTMPRNLSLYSCRSDNEKAATITPEGHLGRCESHIDSGLWGSVFSEERDEEVLRQWRERRPREEICQACAIYPRCVRLKKCAIRTERCSPIEREEMRIKLVRGILDTYRAWKSSNAPQN